MMKTEKQALEQIKLQLKNDKKFILDDETLKRCTKSLEYTMKNNTDPIKSIEELYSLMGKPVYYKHKGALGQWYLVEDLLSRDAVNLLSMFRAGTFHRVEIN